MVTFRNVVFGRPLAWWWDNNNNQVAFGRDGKGFIVFNNDDRYIFVEMNENQNLSVAIQSNLCILVDG